MPPDEQDPRARVRARVRASCRGCDSIRAIAATHWAVYCVVHRFVLGFKSGLGVGPSTVSSNSFKSGLGVGPSTVSSNRQYSASQP